MKESLTIQPPANPDARAEADKRSRGGSKHSKLHRQQPKGNAAKRKRLRKIQQHSRRANR